MALQTFQWRVHTDITCICDNCGVMQTYTAGANASYEYIADYMENQGWTRDIDIKKNENWYCPDCKPKE